jgi:bis(5'-nucleosidyl)-tetraphosphatase
MRRGQNPAASWAGVWPVEEDLGMKQEKSCGAMILRRREGANDLEVLVIRQNQGHWCFPKGHVEKDETEQETALREVKEETGLSIAFVNSFRDETSYSPQEGVMKQVVYFLARPAGGHEHIQEDELTEMRWLKPYDALALITYGNDRALLRNALRHIREHDLAAAFLVEK